MTYSYVLLQFLLVPLLIGILVSGLVEIWKRTAHIKYLLIHAKGPLVLWLLVPLLTLSCRALFLLLQKSDAFWLSLLLHACGDIGMAEVWYSHFLKPIRNGR